MSANPLDQLHFHRSNRASAEQRAQRPVTPILPALPAQFIGRQAETQQAIALWQRLRPRQSPRIMAIVGQAGVGKSMFALHLAHQIRSRFTDGQISLNLRSDPALSAATIAQQICRALGVEDLSELRDRRILLLLDAIEPSQLQPLLKLVEACKLSEDWTILLTRVQPIAEIAAIELQPLSSADGIALLQAIAPAKPIQAEAQTAKAIVQLCDNLPLPLCMIAALLQQPQFQLEDCWQQLTEERKRCEQANFSYPATRACFNLSYRRLDAATAQLLRRIGVLAEPILTAETAATLGETESAQASLALLRQMRLLEWSGAYRLPDPLRRLVKAQLAIEETAETRQALRLRLAQHYQKTAELLDSGWNDRPIFERDRPNFLAAIDWAVQAQAWPIAIPTIASLTPFMLDRGEAATWLPLLQKAIAAASSPVLQAQLHNLIANTYAHLGDWENAQSHYQQSLQHLQDRQEPFREAQTIANLGLIYRQQNNLEAAAMQWAIAIGRLPAGSAADRDLLEWMQSIDPVLLQKAESRVDRPAASSFLGAIGSIFKHLF